MDQGLPAEDVDRYPTPAAIAKLGRSRLAARLTKRAPGMGGRLADEIIEAMAQQTVTVIGTDAAGTVLPQLARQLAIFIAQRAELAAHVDALVEAHPLYAVLISMPGIGIRTAARILTEDGRERFPDLRPPRCIYAGLVPVTRRSGSSIRGEHRSRRGNKRLKRALFLSAFAALHDPVSRACHDRKRAQGKSYNQATTPSPDAAATSSMQ